MKPLIFSLILLSSIGAKAEARLSPFQIYDKTTTLVTQRFYDQTFRGLNWPKLVSNYRKKITGASTPNQLHMVLNQLLSQLHASHTEFLTSDEQEYHGLKSIFSRKIDGDRYYQAGGCYQQIKGRWFIRNAFPDSPLAQAGLVSGDEIISVNSQPFSEIKSFDTPHTVLVEYRRQNGGHPHKVTLTPEWMSAQEILLRSTRHSAKIIPVAGLRVGYFHLWSGTNDLFLQATLSAVRRMAQTTDAMILDLRDGYGGAWTPYIQQFFEKDLNTGKPVPVVYSKPLYVLINDGVRSGKEYLAYIFKRYDRATLIGSNTAGHFLGGEYFDIEPDHYALYLAVAGDPTGQLEGRGVAPDVDVSAPLPYSKGRDVQLENAEKLIAQKLVLAK